MKSINYVIVRTDSDYNNEVELSSGTKLVVNSTIESVEHINRIGIVEFAPDFTLLKQGDQVIIHHNIFRLRNGVNGNQIPSDYMIKKGQYFVPLTEVFMYKRENDDWVAFDPYCFVKPIKKEEQFKNGIIIPDKVNSHKGRHKNIGIMMYPNKQLAEMGVKRGDKVVFSDDSEYEFKINGEVYYKMSTRDILAKIEDERT